MKLCDKQHPETGRKYLLSAAEKMEEEREAEEAEAAGHRATDKSSTTSSLPKRHLSEMKRLVHTFRKLHQDKAVLLGDLSAKMKVRIHL